MAFNRNTFKRNQYRKSAWKYLAEARAAKAAGGWQAARVSNLVKLARIDMRLHLSYR